MLPTLSRLLYLLNDKTLRNQIFRFVVAGCFGLTSDMMVYRTLVSLNLHVTPAKALGCIAGTTVVFFINRSWTFSQHQKSFGQFLRFAALYATSISINTTLNTLGLELLPEPWQVAFVFATGVSTVINFLGSKFIVFKPMNEDDADVSADLA